MDTIAIEERPGIVTRLMNLFRREDEGYADEPEAKGGTAAHPLTPSYRYTVTVRRQVVSFDEAHQAAYGLKRGEQQILNLSGTDPLLRQKIVDFMCGVNFAEEGTWEEIGDHIYLIVPNNAFVEASPSSARAAAVRN